jgi:hypothetical protein
MTIHCGAVGVMHRDFRYESQYHDLERLGLLLRGRFLGNY